MRRAHTRRQDKLLVRTRLHYAHNEGPLVKLEIISKWLNDRPEIGDTKSRDRFAWYPMWDDHKEKFVWLEWIWELREYRKYHDLEGLYIGKGWSLKKRYQACNGHWWRFFVKRKWPDIKRTLKKMLSGASPDVCSYGCWYVCKGHDEAG